MDNKPSLTLIADRFSYTAHGINAIKMAVMYGGRGNYKETAAIGCQYVMGFPKNRTDLLDMVKADFNVTIK